MVTVRQRFLEMSVDAQRAAFPDLVAYLEAAGATFEEEMGGAYWALSLDGDDLVIVTSDGGGELTRGFAVGLGFYSNDSEVAYEVRDEAGAMALLNEWRAARPTRDGRPG